MKKKMIKLLMHRNTKEKLEEKKWENSSMEFQNKTEKSGKPLNQKELNLEDSMRNIYLMVILTKLLKMNM